MALDLVYPRPSVEGDALPFFAEPVAAGFPSPALFPYRSGCQSKQSYINSIYFSLLNPIWVCIQSLTKLTVVRALKALNSKGAASNPCLLSRCCSSFFILFVAGKE